MPCIRPLSNVVGLSPRSSKRVSRSEGPAHRRYFSFAKPVSNENLETMTQWLEDWEASPFVAVTPTTRMQLRNGGLCHLRRDTGPIEDDYTVQMPILRVGAPDIAWNSLLNLCGRIHSDLASIARVEIRA